MDIGRFTRLAAACGAARERWPEDQRVLYDRFASTPEGMAILADAGRVDALLDAWDPGVDDTGRAARILAAAIAPEGAAPGADLFAAAAAHRARRLAGWLSTGFAASAVLGFVLGFTQAGATGEDGVYAELLFGNTSVMEEFL